MAKQILSKTYNPFEVERRVYQLWQKSGFFNPDHLSRINTDIRVNQRKYPRKSAFTIVIPPPNVTGSLHMGHALNATIQDILIRFYRMTGYQALWVPGTDHAGIATQNVVEKELKKEGLTRKELGREKFVERVWQWVNKYGHLIIEQLKKLGCSCDWSRQRFTLDKEYIEAVKTAFLHYYKKGLIYRGPRIVNWCPRCETAISDIEVKYQPAKGKLYYIRYPLRSQINADRDADKRGLLYKELTYKIRGCIFKVYNKLGPGHKEGVYQKALEEEFKELNLNFEEEKSIEILYADKKVGIYKPDFIIENKIILEIKALPFLGRLEEKQIWHYLKGSEHRLALLVNFGGKELEIRRVIYYDTARIGDIRVNQRSNPRESATIVVATTRPETMLGDTAVAVNPKDERYKDLVGEKVILPIMNREIPIIVHHLVDPQFGTGAVKITPAHDATDWQIGKEKKLEIINVIGPQAKMTEEAGKYTGLSVLEARQKIVEELKSLGLLEKEKKYTHNLALCDRCRTPIEPQISKQWFVKMKKLAQPAIDVVKNGKIKIIPGRYKKIYLDWLACVEDWCISRQLWWGHTLPIWYCRIGKKSKIKNQKSKINLKNSKLKIKNSEFVVSLKKPKRCPICRKCEMKQSEEVLDTWFSSALWPFATLGFPKKTSDLKKYYPTNFLSTAQEILYLWVARMVFSSLEFIKKIPFKDVYIHPTVLAISGKRMSKSLGTGIDPLEIGEKYGFDAVRMGLIYQTNREQQSFKFDERAILAARNFINKLWNISRFVEMSTKQILNPKSEILNKFKIQNSKFKIKPITLADKWILSRLNSVIESVTKKIKNYELGEAMRELYDFTWHEFADWYIEISKTQMSKLKTQNSTTFILQNCLLTILKLLHPFIPFVTEQIYQQIYSPTNYESKRITNLLVVVEWPKANKKLINKKAEKEFEKIKKIVVEIRNLRQKEKMPTGQILEYKIKKKYSLEDKEIIEKLARIKLI